MAARRPGDLAAMATPAALLGALALSAVCGLLLSVAADADAKDAEDPVPSYSNYSVVRVVPASVEQLRLMDELIAKKGLQAWTRPRLGGQLDLGVPAGALPEVRQYLASVGIEHRVLHDNLQDLLDEVARAQARSRLASRSSSGRLVIDNKRFLTVDEVDRYLDQLQAESNGLVKLHDIGRSAESRRMRVAQVTDCARCGYPAVWLDAGVHARERAAPATALFALSQLADNASAGGANLRANLDWFVLPLGNPDGYQYALTKDPMWRKTRMPNPEKPSCKGTDINRNFDFHWNEDGMSRDPCEENYQGPKPFSAPEARNIKNFIWRNRRKLNMYISVHSYGPYVLYPWGYSTSDKPDNVQQLRSIALKAAEAMNRTGSQGYTAMSAAELYPAGGGSDDWAKGAAGIGLSYTIELPGFDDGFTLRPHRIDEVARQAFEGLRVLANAARQSQHRE